jgi:putative SOS response-associated peptidase YedK
MCGRFVQDDDLNEVLTNYALDGHRFPHYQPHWNLAPTQTIGLIRTVTDSSGPTQRLLGPARWSLVPPWEETLALPYSTFNARAEKVGSTRTFRGALGRQRALVPTGGYYEWVTSDGDKTPHFISSTTDTPLAFAALYSWWQPEKNSPPLCTATILTTDSPQPLSWIHPRIPLFAPEDSWEEWLNPDREGNQRFVDDLIAGQATVTNLLEAWPVGPVRGDGPQLVTPLES